MIKSTLTFEKFVIESLEKLKIGKILRGIIAFSNEDGWLNLNKFIPLFNTTRKRWMANLTYTFQEDFFIINFTDSKQDEKDKYFFIKKFSEENYYSYLVFSYEDYDDFRKFKAFINRNPNMWLGWVGSQFIEKFDQFLNQHFPEYNVELNKYTTEKRDPKYKEKKGSTINWEIRNKEELEKIREFHRDVLNELFYVKLVKYHINNGKTFFTMSLSDKTEFTLESGGLIEFLAIYQYLLKYTEKLRKYFTRRIYINREKKFIQKINTQIETFNVDRIEIINLEMNEPFFKNWYNNLINVFSSGFLEEHYIICFQLEKGNPYFLVEIIDLENSSRIFLSSIKNTIRISPASEETNPGTISKLLSILQSNVDPSINISI